MVPPLDESLLSRSAAAHPEWVAELHRRGLELFEKLEMPSEKEEVWRYVELDFDLADLEVPESPGTPTRAESLLDDVAGKARVVDGFTIAAEHDAGEGVVFSSLAGAMVDHEAELSEALGTGIPADLDVFSAAHHAFFSDGVFLYVPSGRTVTDPFLVEVEATADGSLTLPHVTAVLGQDAEASLVVAYRSPEQLFCVVVPQVEASVGEDGRFRLSTVQDWGYDTRAVAQEKVVAGRQAAVRVGEAGLGARLGRLHLTVELPGQGSSAEVVGLYFGELEQVLDYRLFMHHMGPNTRSDIFLKGAVEDQSHSVFTGLIKIWKEAQKTDAFETNRNLVLSEGAGAESVPNLEILANDVRCGHGSTVGPIDEDQRYYLMTRGLAAPAADRLIVRGFFEEVLRRFPQPELGGPLRGRVNDKFVIAQEEGRI